MTSHTSRRAFLAATPAALALSAASALATTETPIQRLFRRWVELMDASNTAGRSLSDKEWAALQPERHDVEEAILAESPTDMRDLAMKVLVSSGEGCFAISDVLTLECAQIAGRNFDRMPRCLFEKESAD